MKKNILNISCLSLMAMLILISCKKVERLPETSISDPSFWNSEADLKSATNYLYNWLPNITSTPAPATPVASANVLDDVWSDDAYGTASNQISDGSRLAPATDATNYNDPYRLIRAANNVIANAGRVPVDAAIRNKYLSEAKFFRAWGYFFLLQRYGGVPLITTVLTEDSPELYAAKAPRKRVVDTIYADLDFAAQNLPLPTALNAAGGGAAAGANYGRLTKTAAWAFKARVALFEGTWSKFQNDGDPVPHLTKARDAAKLIIDSKEHDLFSNYFNLFQYEGEGFTNKENILVRKFGVSTTDQVAFQNTSRAMETGFLNPTKSLVDSYLMTDGLPITKSPIYVTPTTIAGQFTNRDTRMGATIFKKGDPYTTGTYNIAPLAFQRTGYGTRKYFNSTDWSTQRGFIDRVVIRYAEVLLIYAEALYELNGSISDADLNATVNRLRTRGGVAALTNAFAANNNLNMRDEIRRERRVELAMEGFRYWDLLRWKTAEIELPKAVLGSYFFSEFGSSTAVTLTPDNFILLQAASARKFNPSKDYLWPFPINQLSLNPALQQNPGWQ
jgi:hypothetical protein